MVTHLLRTPVTAGSLEHAKEVVGNKWSVFLFFKEVGTQTLCALKALLKLPFLDFRLMT